MVQNHAVEPLNAPAEPSFPDRPAAAVRSSSQTAKSGAYAKPTSEPAAASPSLEQLAAAPQAAAATAGSKRKADDSPELQDALQRSLAEYSQVVHRAPTKEDGPPIKMRSPTRKRHRLATSSNPAAATAVDAAGSLAEQAVLQAAAAAATPAEAAHAAEQAAKAAAEAVGTPPPTSPAASGSDEVHGAKVRAAL